MEVFLTGGTGYVGGAVLRAVRERGHRVTALVRREGALVGLGDPGVRTVVGDLARPEGYAEEAAGADAIVHCALQYGPDGEERTDLEEATVRALLDAAVTDQPGHVVYTSSLFEPPAVPDAPLKESIDGGIEGWRAELEKQVLAEPPGGAVIRLGFVYGGTGGYLWDMLAPGPAGTVRFATAPEGSRWPFVHVEDLAELYALVVEGRAQGVFHGAAGAPLPVEEVARIVAGQMASEPERLAPREALATLEGVGSLMLRDVLPDARRGAELGWAPRHPSFRDAAPEAYRAYRAHQGG
jgi:nucleoside-diphosphate-sugar epimerase